MLFLFIFFIDLSTCFLVEIKNDICTLPKNSGPCEGSEVYWYYNYEKLSCKKFIYGGCGGNQNRFQSQLECIMNCQSLNSKLSIKGTKK